MPTSKTTPPKTTVKKPRAPRKASVKAEKTPALAHPKTEHPKKVAEPKPAEAPKEQETHQRPKGRYVFATGRRKTAIANVRLFAGKGETVVNKKPLKDYFRYEFYNDEVIRPFEVTGLVGKYHFVARIIGGGTHSQAQALRHGISLALALAVPDSRKVLKKNGFLTRDPRAKERKKPGLKRARRAPQWAKR